MISYRAPTTADAVALSAMAATSFAATFGDVVRPADMPIYLERAYGRDGQMTRDLADPAVRWRMALQDAAPVGYLKLSAMTLPYDAAPGAMEVRQLYVAQDVKGAGVAATLMEWAIDTARAAGASELYLAVFDHNVRAVRFYARYGFVKVGRFDFVTGDQVHDDGIWRRPL